MLPNPHDAAFAALGNTAAAPLLAPERATFQTTSYPGALSDARQLVDQHGDNFWAQLRHHTLYAK
jgi:hypothetical protein